MRKKILALSTVSIVTMLPPMSFAGSPDMSGFIDVGYSRNDDINLFLANAEVDLSSKLSEQVSVRIDTDLAIANKQGENINGTLNTIGAQNGPSDSAAIEQAYFALSAIPQVTVIGGVFNNPIGFEKEDAPDKNRISTGQIYQALDGQTAMYGNNIAGVAVAGSVGPATITVAVLNDIGLNDLEKNSFAAVVNATPIKNLDLELGYVTQEGGVENVLDINASYSMMGATVGLEYLKPDEALDSVTGLSLNYAITDKYSALAMYDVKTPKTGKDTTSYAVGASANLASNLNVAAEYYSMDDGNDEDPTVLLRFLAKF